MKTRRMYRTILATVIAFGALVAATPNISQATSVAAADPGDPSGPFCASIPAEGEGSFEAWPMTRPPPQRRTTPF